MALHEFVPRRENRRVWLSLLAAAVLVPAVVRSEYLLNTAVLAGIYVILASSLNITNGYTGLFSFGHAAFYGIGAYTAAILATRFGLGFWLILPLAGLAAAVFGAALAVPTLRLSGIFLALVTIGFQEITFLVTLHWIGLTQLRDGERQWFDLAARTLAAGASIASLPAFVNHNVEQLA